MADLVGLHFAAWTYGICIDRDMLRSLVCCEVFLYWCRVNVSVLNHFDPIQSDPEGAACMISAAVTQTTLS